ncbi:alternative ribosome rescue aminoacyl-tRNA hydrolase ArfB [Mesonia maritima]|uniref:Ribosome-associated protein n=1 Tax=Mesonia maritima TaxID=1793873 RepID=A0ABU1K1P9_9FLAO|nr:alternative ribosome rescue aminoacyl-tRNA hydrolase ArfB [Mesonia maritima]MDR6299535.1 ribosome-associated protein [Mesonia maritima]
MKNKDQLLAELNFKAVLSGGPGGQHANKTSTKILLEWNLSQSALFSEEEKERLQQKLKNRITKEGILQLSSDHTRSQHKNKEIVQTRFLRLLEDGLKIPRKRKKTKPSKKSKLKRLQNKKRQADKKANRKNPLL